MSWRNILKRQEEEEKNRFRFPTKDIKLGRLPDGGLWERPDAGPFSFKSVTADKPTPTFGKPREKPEVGVPDEASPFRFLERDLATGEFKPPETNIWKSWENPWEDMGKLERVFSILNRDQHAVANVAWSLLQGEDDVIEAAWRGITAEERGDFIDILRHYNVPWAPLLGTVLNIGLSPSTYLGGPVKLFKTLSGKMGVTKALERTTDIIKETNPISTITRAFTQGGLTPAQVTRQLNLNNYAYRKETAEALSNLTKRLGKITEEEFKLFRQVARGELPLDQTTRAKFEAVSDFTTEMFQELVDAYALKPETIEKFMREGLNFYYPQRLVRDVAQYLPGRHLRGKAQKPPALFKKKGSLTLDEYKEVSEALDQMSKMTDIEKIQRKANALVAIEDSPFGPRFARYVKSIIKEDPGNVRKIQKELRKLSVEFTPIEDLTTLLALYKVETAKIIHQQRAVDELFKLDNVQRWAPDFWDATMDGVLPSGKKAVVRLSEIVPYLRNYTDGLESMPKVTAKALKARLNEIKKMGKSAKTHLRRFDVDYEKQNRLFGDLVEIPEGTAKALLGRFKDAPVRVIDDDLVRHLTGIKEFEIGGRLGKQFLQWWDKSMGLWKAGATIFRLPFHARNLASNIGRQMQDGMSLTDLPKYYGKAFDILARPDKKVSIGGVWKTGQEWLGEFSARGVRGYGYVGQFTADEYLGLGEDLMQLIRGTAKKGLVDRFMDSFPVSKAKAVARNIEDFSRISHAMWETENLVRKGAKFGDALNEGAFRSWKTLFQYDQLSDFEQGFMKKAIPFYTWMRKNAEFQIKTLLENPKYTARKIKMYNMLRFSSEPEERRLESMPQYLQDYAAFKVPKDLTKVWSKFTGTETPDDVYAHIGFAWNDWVRLTEGLEGLIHNVNPAVGILFGQASGIDMFPVARPIEKFEGEIVPAPWPMSVLPFSVWDKLGMETIIDKDSGKRILGMPARAASLLQDLFPPLRELSRMYPDRRIDIEDARAPWAKLRYITGINFTPVDRAEQFYYEKLDRQDKLSVVARHMSMLGRPLTGEELEKILEDK